MAAPTCHLCAGSGRVSTPVGFKVKECPCDSPVLVGCPDEDGRVEVTYADGRRRTMTCLDLGIELGGSELARNDLAVLPERSIFTGAPIEGTFIGGSGTFEPAFRAPLTPMYDLAHAAAEATEAIDDLVDAMDDDYLDEVVVTDDCRAKRHRGTPAYDGPHEPHGFTYGASITFHGHCGGHTYEDTLHDLGIDIPNVVDRNSLTAWMADHGWRIVGTGTNGQMWERAAHRIAVPFDLHPGSFEWGGTLTRVGAPT
jgi:hypothetical protein